MLAKMVQSFTDSRLRCNGCTKSPAQSTVSCHTTTHAALESAKHRTPLAAQALLVHRLSVSPSDDPPHECRVFRIAKLPSVATCQIFAKPLLLSLVEWQAHQLSSPGGDVGSAMPSKDRLDQLLEEELSCRIGSRAREVERFGNARLCHGFEEGRQGGGGPDSGLDGVVVCKGTRVVVLLAVLIGVLNENDNNVVCELWKNGRMCEVPQSSLVKDVSERSRCSHVGKGDVQQIVGGPSSTGPS